MDFNRVRLYFISYNLYLFSSGLITVFLNLFVLATTSLLGVIYFNVCYYAGIEILYFASALGMAYIDPKALYIMGSFIRALSLVLIILSAVFVSNVIIFGLLYGGSIGTLALGYNILSSDVSKGVDRKRFVYNNSVIGGIATFIAPTIAGIMIQYSQFAGPLKFVYDFAAAVLFMLASAYFMRRMKVLEKPYHKRFTVEDSKIRTRGYKYYKIYFSLSLLFQLIFPLIMPIYVFLITNNYVITGLYTSLLLIIGVFANYLVKVRYVYWNSFLKFGILLTVASSIPLLLPQYVSSLLAVFLFSIVYTIFSTPFNNQMTSNFLEFIDRSGIDRIRFWVNREYYIIIGRAIILAAMILILVYSNSNIVLLVYLFPFLAVHFLIYLKVSQRESQSPEPKISSIIPFFEA